MFKLKTFCCSVAKSFLTFCDLMDSSMPGFPVLHYVLEFAHMFIELVMPSNHLILCHPLLLLSCPQSFLASGSFPVSQLFTSGDQSTGTSASASVLPMSIQGRFPLRSTGSISAVQGTLRSLLQHHSSKASILYALPSLRSSSHNHV